jgi:hypothetical protein
MLRAWVLGVAAATLGPLVVAYRRCQARVTRSLYGLTAAAPYGPGLFAPTRPFYKETPSC